MSIVMFYLVGGVFAFVLLIPWLYISQGIVKFINKMGGNVGFGGVKALIALFVVFVLIAYVSNPDEDQLNSFVKESIFQNSPSYFDDSSKPETSSFINALDILWFSSSSLARYNFGWVSINELTSPDGNVTILGIFGRHFTIG